MAAKATKKAIVICRSKEHIRCSFQLEIKNKNLSATIHELKLVASCFGLKLDMHIFGKTRTHTTYFLQISGDADLVEAYIEDATEWLGYKH